MLSGITQRRALPRYQNEEMKMLNTSNIKAVSPADIIGFLLSRLFIIRMYTLYYLLRGTNIHPYKFSLL